MSSGESRETGPVMDRRTLLGASLAATGLVSACSSIGPLWRGPSGDQGTVGGTVTYLEPIALPDSAELLVNLVQLPDDAGRTMLIAQSIQVMVGQVPLSFEIRYARGLIDAALRYGLEATIVVDDTVLFANSEPYPVITQGAGSFADMLLKRPE